MSSNGTVTSHRDDELGRRLRQLDVPEHGAAFYAELRARLEHEEPVRAGRRRSPWRYAAVAVAAIVVAGAIGLPRLGGGSDVGPSVASAAVVQARVRDALAAMRTLSGTLISTGPARDDQARWRFMLDDRGDARLDGPGAGEVVTYDAATGVARSAQHSASMGGSAVFYAERRGVAPGAPDQGPPTWILPAEFAAYVRAALDARDLAVRLVTYRGRPAWRLDVAAARPALDPALSGGAFQITVDRATGMPVRVDELQHGAVLRELRITGLAIDRTLPADAFRLAFPAGADVARSDDGFRRVSLAEAARGVGYAPLVPATVPGGYRLVEVATARTAAPVGGNPASRMVVSLAYRRGLDQFVVTTRLRDDASWSDPFAAQARAATVPIDRGALSGARAHVVLVPGATPQVWASTARLVVTIAGDLSRQELVEIASSLHAR